ncbi:hypothetical protein [Actinacidiphila guanduensis]|uniref:Toxin-antitoxin system HicB family antitoxin n=1 Tax=Actinacidiphila guanduensis TaxID=310781 RepID=A0A1H0ABS3_9ACTN|nr:hypothetical protein [Actinacidiphila guanduensis]SDN30754.1 hypothetical protein SAMN05216259_103479 [Actinacidiphila guanduensis]
MTDTGRPARKQVLLRLDPAVHDALAAWAAGELRSTNAQIEYLLRRALADAGRLPAGARPIPRRGRPPKDPASAVPAQDGRSSRADQDGKDDKDSQDDRNGGADQDGKGAERAADG